MQWSTIRVHLTISESPLCCSPSLSPPESCSSQSASFMRAESTFGTFSSTGDPEPKYSLPLHRAVLGRSDVGKVKLFLLSTLNAFQTSFSSNSVGANFTSGNTDFYEGSYQCLLEAPWSEAEGLEPVHRPLQGPPSGPRSVCLLPNVQG